jgi:cholesterol oxidase
MVDHEHFHVVVVGSGFGGSVMALRLAEAHKKVCVLERGRKFPPGSFPRSPHALAQNVWDRSRGLTGLYDFWSFDHFEALVSSGLGGGSLIYANVLLRMPEEWFVTEHPDGTTTPWPVTRAELAPHYDEVERMLGATLYPPSYAGKTPKTIEFTKAAARAGLAEQEINLAVTFAPPGDPEPRKGAPLGDRNLHHAPRETCRLCGECDLGCNYGSKNTMDLTYLSEAEQGANPPDIRARSEVVWIRPLDGGGFEVEYIEHPEHLDEKPRTEDQYTHQTITAEKLVLAAGSLATTHLLLRNRSSFPDISPQLGSRFSGNGDLLAFLSGTTEMVDPSNGTVITSALKVPDRLNGGTGRGFFIQDGGFPEFFNWFVQGFPTLGRLGRYGRFGARQVINHLRHNPRSEVSSELRNVLGRQRSAYSLPILGMGRDTPDGVMTLRDDYLAINWSIHSSLGYFERVRDAFRRLGEQMGARLKDTVLWRLRRVITVHPVGGCPMGHDEDEGVVNSFGEVFGYPGLVIADGSVLPGPAGANPSLTIAALAERFADNMIATW